MILLYLEILVLLQLTLKKYLCLKVAVSPVNSTDTYPANVSEHSNQTNSSNTSGNGIGTADPVVANHSDSVLDFNPESANVAENSANVAENSMLETDSFKNQCLNSELQCEYVSKSGRLVKRPERLGY